MTETSTLQPAPDRSGTPLVELRHIRVAFGGVHAVDDVSIDLYPGEVIGLVGGNGAGKSTLMHTLSGAHPADSGEIVISGEPVAIRNPREARQHGIEVADRQHVFAVDTGLQGGVGVELVEPDRREGRDGVERCGTHERTRASLWAPWMDAAVVGFFASSKRTSTTVVSSTMLSV